MNTHPRVFASLALAFSLFAAACSSSAPPDDPTDSADELRGACGGIANLTCRAGYSCSITDKHPDATGVCKKTCGGIANIGCSNGYECVITEKYPDASGLCTKKAPGADAGSDAADASARHFATDTKFEYVIGVGCVAPTNCKQYGKFGKDGSAFVLLTDEPNAGQYELQGNKIVATFFTSSDGGERMTFTLSEDGKSAVNDADGKIWLLVP